MTDILTRLFGPDPDPPALRRFDENDQPCKPICPGHEWQEIAWFWGATQTRCMHCHASPPESYFRERSEGP